VDEMKNPTELEMADAYRREFPLCNLSGPERAFLAFIHLSRRGGAVGYGWMRQAIGMAWKLADPLGYIDDQRIIDLNADPQIGVLLKAERARIAKWLRESSKTMTAAVQWEHNNIADKIEKGEHLKVSTAKSGA
jgi:hypothetical protein